MRQRGVPAARALVAAIFLFASLWYGAGGQSLQFAGLVVRHSDDQFSYAYVGFAEPEITGIELLRRSGLEVVTIAFGGLGEGVCSIDATGCPASDCRRRVCQGPSDEDPFWQYFRQQAPGEWKALVLGASATKVRHGDIDGWSWTPEEPGLPALTLESVAELAGYDGVAFNGNEPGRPGAALRRASPFPDDEGQPIAIYAGGAVVLALAAGALGFVAWRTRSAEAAG